ncbi:peptidyl-tRNA hydrolase [Trichodelitschia bisporula]|uniref:peptidyl-tRNA hydrolase n=1 Tax=Trichodelitschia bisporula TaxID=703511 RepID=A0A6G1I9I3_9PEZI|nr:peptidyl-tRNA hydrolase [Trichodelitschia bisporula]
MAPHNRKRTRRTPDADDEAFDTPDAPAFAPEPAMPRPPSVPLLIAAIGNPSTAYKNTLHSAGHTVLRNVRTHLAAPPFRAHLGGEISAPGPERRLTLLGVREVPLDAASDDGWAFWISGTFMNVSGPAVKRVWDRWRREGGQHGVRSKYGCLVVVHDELEKPVGEVTVREGGSSAKGHNGIKSIQAALGSNTPWVRIGVGIGRPASREADVVSKHVLRKMTPAEERRIEAATPEVLQLLRDIADGVR